MKMFLIAACSLSLMASAATASEFTCHTPGFTGLIEKKSCDGNDPTADSLDCKAFSISIKGRANIITPEQLGIKKRKDGYLALQPANGVDIIPIESEDNIYAIQFDSGSGGNADKEYYAIISSATNKPLTKLMSYSEFHKRMEKANITLSDPEWLPETCKGN